MTVGLVVPSSVIWAVMVLMTMVELTDGVTEVVVSSDGCEVVERADVSAAPAVVEGAGVFVVEGTSATEVVVLEEVLCVLVVVGAASEVVDVVEGAAEVVTGD